MAWLKYRNPKIDNPGCLRIADPSILNENFEDIARLLNGGLGAENLAPGRVFDNTALVNGYGLAALTFNYDTFSFNTLALATNFQVLILPSGVSGKILGCAVSGASTATPFSAQFRVGATVKLSIDPPNPGDIEYFVGGSIGATPFSPALAAGDTLLYRIIAGTCRTLVLYVSFPHRA